MAEETPRKRAKLSGSNEYLSQVEDGASLEQGYWDQLFERNMSQNITSEFLLSFESIKSVVSPYLRDAGPDAPALIAGFGDSTSTPSMFNNGLKDMVLVDISSVAVQKMKSVFADQESVTVYQCDARDLPLEESTMSSVFDKGLLDCAVHLAESVNPSASAHEDVSKLLDQYFKVLIPGTVCVIVSRYRPDCFLKYVSRDHYFSWVENVTGEISLPHPEEWEVEVSELSFECNEFGQAQRNCMVTELDPGAADRMSQEALNENNNAQQQQRSKTEHGKVYVYALLKEYSDIEHDEEGQLQHDHCHEHDIHDDDYSEHQDDCNCPRCGGYETLKEEYWDSLYSSNQVKSTTSEYLLSYKTLSPFMVDPLRSKIASSSLAKLPILIPGCGDTTFSEELYNDGFKYQINCDISSKVIDIMKERTQDKPEMKWFVADITSTGFENESIGVVLDKSLIDCMFWIRESEGNLVDLITKVVQEYHRVIVPGGYCVVATTRYPSEFLPMVDCVQSKEEGDTSKPAWSVSMTEIRVETSDQGAAATNARAFDVTDVPQSEDPVNSARYCVYQMTKL